MKNASSEAVPTSLLPSISLPLHVLVVDDAPSIIKVTKRFLLAHGHTVETAENGSEALEKLKSSRVVGSNGELVSVFDLMLTDIQMPVMDGMECTTRYRQWENEGVSSSSEGEKRGDGEVGKVGEEGKEGEGNAVVTNRHRRLPIVGMSANNDEVFATNALAGGIDAFIAKVGYRK